MYFSCGILKKKIKTKWLSLKEKEIINVQYILLVTKVKPFLGKLWIKGYLLRLLSGEMGSCYIW